MNTSQPNSEIVSKAKEFEFLMLENWSEELGKRSDIESADFYRQELVPAEIGLGYCIDERPIALDDPARSENPKPAFVGGAAGWVVLFMLRKMDLVEAVEATTELYKQNGWGEMQIHTDDHSVEGKVGCGFLNVFQNVIRTLQILNIPGTAQDIELLEGTEIFMALKQAGAKVVTLTGKHKTDVAKVVVNQVEGTTFDRQALYDLNPAFLWDAWATTNEPVRDSFNELAGDGEEGLDANNFLRLQAALHLVTGSFLGAVHLEGPEKNVVLLSE